ncbi:hypothetical protein NIES4071_85200 [Calothrix sp. NIES-4071]|nr:hypothetical protein NIES4071_85200 [Calothrix sp. NIES-4071]BAZ62787.1 hypothetical protein NIES4105_85130 [Calothrix sp. NIES-4105]
MEDGEKLFPYPLKLLSLIAQINTDTAHRYAPLAWSWVSTISLRVLIWLQGNI